MMINGFEVRDNFEEVLSWMWFLSCLCQSSDFQSPVSIVAKIHKRGKAPDVSWEATKKYINAQYAAQNRRGL
jgi:hypothetical protein